MLHRLLNVPLKLIPQPVTAVTLSIVLNLFFSRYPDLKKQLSELSGKIFEFEVTDLEESYFMSIDNQGSVSIHTYCDTLPHVTMSGHTKAFLSLLFQTTDPDSLFFSRTLTLSGETDTGLHFKNILNNVDVDWEKELSVLFTAPVARSLMAMARQVQTVTEKSKERFDDEIEQWLEGQHLPTRGKFEPFRADVEALQARTDRLEKTLSRLSKKEALTQHVRQPTSPSEG